MAKVQISTHALREEGDWYNRFTSPVPLAFLPTPSARRATVPTPPRERQSTYFYPRPPRGGRRPARAAAIMPVAFLPTPSARRATATRSTAG